MKIDNEIKNWKDYLERKFSDQSIYTIDDKTNVLSNGVYNVTAKGSKTEISFIYPDKDWLTIDDIQFHNSKVNGWSGELLGGNGPKRGKFNQENIDYVNKVLETPLKKGWTCTDYSLFGKVFKSVTREGMKPKVGIKILTDFNFGCIGTILFPITFLINIGIEIGLIGKKKTSIIKPMVE
ncbi:hypothetical protein [Psychroserpens ponticola]|uniref:Uncharacterized protein n=1 Tax=Psychroserpens ponticola TaxID=2932268 RepID=A0ABY7S2T7_9FLAO|nr:hypothetical protein [Psychroserpens ponticola]WCO03484.1 hypothetical protein MUN68_008240 [Psychroserpens ponticola]